MVKIDIRNTATVATKWRPQAQRPWFGPLPAFMLLLIFLGACSQAGRGSVALAGADSTDSADAVAEAAANEAAGREVVTSDTVTAAITLAPGSGYAGTFVDVSGKGWPASTLVLVKLADEEGLSSVMAAIAADAEGHFNTGFVYPVGARWLQPGAQPVLAHTEDGAVTATSAFTVAPPEGVEAATATPMAATTQAASVTAASAVMATPAPGITPTIALATGALASMSPYVAVDPFAGRAGTVVTVSGGGFPANSAVSVALVETHKASEPASLKHVYVTATTDNAGNYRTSLVIPARWPDGALIPVGQLTVIVATADQRTWASVPFDYLGAAPPDAHTVAPSPTSTVDGKHATKVTLCHRPPGNPNNAHTITVDQSAVPAHLVHGDLLGACEEHGVNAGAPKEGKDKQEKDKQKDKENGKGEGKGNK